MNRLSQETSTEMYAIHHTIICRFAKPNLTGDRRPISIFYLRQKVERLRHQVSGSFVSCVPSSTSSFVSSVSSGASSSESLCCLACDLKVFQPSWSYEQTCPQERLLNPPLKCCFPSAVWEIPLAPVTLPPQPEAWNLFHLLHLQLVHLPWLQALLPPCTNPCKYHQRTLVTSIAIIYNEFEGVGVSYLCSWSLERNGRCGISINHQEPLQLSAFVGPRAWVLLHRSPDLTGLLEAKAAETSYL